MSSAYYVCCIYLNDSITTLNMKANNMNTMNLRSSLILVHIFSNKCNYSTSADEKTDDTSILGNGVKTRPYTLPSATDSACQNQQNDLSNQRIPFLSAWKTLFLSAWKTLIPNNCNYLYSFSYTQISWAHAKVVLNIRWAHISLYSFCHVRHHILVQAKFNECSVKIADFSEPCNYWSACVIFVV